MSYEEIVVSKPPQSLMKIIPSYAIVGFNDVLPGIKGDNLYIEHASDLDSLAYDPQSTIVINNISLSTPGNLYPLLLKAIEMEYEDLRMRHEEITDKKIKLISLHIDCNNTWKNVMDTVSISLSQKDDKMFIGSGKIIINNAFLGQYFGYLLTIVCSGITLTSYIHYWKHTYH